MAEHTKEEIIAYVAKQTRLHRALRDMTQDEFAKFLGVSRHTVINYEDGIRLARLDVLMKIASRLDVPVETLLP